MNLQQIEARLLIILDGFEDSLPPNEVEDMRSLTTAGEPGVAFENLCTQLDEYDIAVPTGVKAELATLGSVMGIRSEYWTGLLTAPRS